MTMPSLGHYALILAFMSSIYVAVGGWQANRLGSRHWAESVRGGAVAVWLALSAAVLVLEYLLVSGDYAVRAVYNHSDRALPLIYKVGALWGGDSGSVLFWGWLLSGYLAFVALWGWPREGQMTPMVVPLLAVLTTFFAGLNTFVVNPFATVAGNPQNGVGLNPLLQNAVMTIHPPVMYIGLIGMSVPAAYVMAAVWLRIPWSEWVPVVRRWMVFSWGFLSVAILLGGMWAYMELGWGGYWEWDPVENASLLPWLLATAFLHSLQLEEKRGIYRWWTAFLGMGTFLLTLVGTYITRSGVLKNSVHSFAGTGIGPYFVGLFWLSVASILGVMICRRDMLRDRGQMDGLLSKESLYLLMNVVLSGLTAVVLFGTFYPVISKALFNQTIVLSVNFFNSLTSPLFVVLVLLMGLAPVLGWRQTALKRALRQWSGPFVVGLFAAGIAYWRGVRTPFGTAGVLAIGFTLAMLVREYLRAVRMTQRNASQSWWKAGWRTLMWDRRRYGGYLAHVAFLLIALGVIGSHTGNVLIKPVMLPGQTIHVGNYTIHYLGFSNIAHEGYQTTQANLSVVSGHTMHIAHPGLSFFPGSAQPVANIAILSGVWQDLYVVLLGSPGGGRALLQVFVNPMVSWIWMGMYVLALGTIMAFSAPMRPHPRSWLREENSVRPRTRWWGSPGFHDEGGQR